MNRVISTLMIFGIPFFGYSQISKNCLDLRYEEELKSISTLDSLDQYTVFILGETHNVGSNDLMDYSLLTYLNKNQEVSYFIKEGTYSYNFFLSKYIETGDLYYLNLVGDDFSVIEEREFLDKLVSYNRSVSKSKKIKLYGIDSEPFFHLSTMIDALLYDREIPPKQVSDVFKLLKSFHTDNWSYDISKKEKNEIKKIWELVTPIITNNEKIFKDYLGNDFIHLKMVINNSATFKRSDDGLLENFLKLQGLTGADKFYFSYGSLHSQKKGGWLANQINNTSKFKDKVFSIKTIYHNCTFLWGDDNLPLNTLEKNKENEAKEILKIFDNCEFDFAFYSTEGLSFEKEFDLLLLCRNQKGITIEK